MEITLQAHPRVTDGAWVITAVNDDYIWVDIDQDGLPQPYLADLTEGQRDLLANLPTYFENRMPWVLPIGAIPRFEAHTEDKTRLGDFGDLYITDVATVGGVSVGSDGAYLFHAGKLYAIDEFED